MLLLTNSEKNRLMRIADSYDNLHYQIDKYIKNLNVEQLSNKGLYNDLKTLVANGVYSIELYEDISNLFCSLNVNIINDDLSPRDEPADYWCGDSQEKYEPIFTRIVLKFFNDYIQNNKITNTLQLMYCATDNLIGIIQTYNTKGANLKLDDSSHKVGVSLFFCITARVLTNSERHNPNVSQLALELMEYTMKVRLNNQCDTSQAISKLYLV